MAFEQTGPTVIGKAVDFALNAIFLLLFSSIDQMFSR